MPMIVSLLPAWSAAPAQVTGPPPVVEKAATASGLACRIETAFAFAAGTSKPSSCGLSTFTSGQSCAICSVNVLATRFSTVLNEPSVTATVPLQPISLPIAVAASFA